MAEWMATISNAFSLDRVDKGLRLGIRSKDETKAKLVSWWTVPTEIFSYAQLHRAPKNTRPRVALLHALPSTYSESTEGKNNARIAVRLPLGCEFEYYRVPAKPRTDKGKCYPRC